MLATQRTEKIESTERRRSTTSTSQLLDSAKTRRLDPPGTTVPDQGPPLAAYW